MKLDNVADVYPLTPMQEGMLFHSISDSASGVYVVQMAATLEGELDSDRLIRSIQQVASRFDALRTAFVWDGVDTPLQVVRQHVEFPIAQLDWRAQDADWQRRQLSKLVEENKRQGFRLEAAPLIHMKLCQCSSSRWQLLFCFHHLILDGWSIRTLLNRILDHYDQPESRTEGNEFQFREYIEWMLKQDRQSAVDFWRAELAGFSQPSVIGFQSSREAEQSSYQQKRHLLSRYLSQRLKALARGSRVTLNSVMQALWSLLVSRYSGGDTDIVFGATVAGRHPQLPRIESAIGSFVNTLPFRTTVDSGRSVREWLSEIQSRQAKVRRWEFSSLVDIQKQSDIAAGASLFESILVFENYPVTDRHEGPLLVTDVVHFEQSSYPLALLVVPADRIEWIAVFDQHRFSSSFVDRILEHLTWLADQFVEQPNRLVGELCGLPPSQLSTLTSWQQPEELAADHPCIHQLIREAASRTPDQVAIVSNDQQVTYEELEAQSEWVADFLRHQGVTANDVIGLCTERCVEMIIGIVGILKAGAAYLPLDPAYPSDHLRQVLDDAEVSMVLTKSEHLHRLPVGECDVALFNDVLGEERENRTCKHRAERITSSRDHLAYLIYTSGSTGRPKGVMVSHGNLLHSTLARSEYYDRDPRSFLLLSSFAFDSSIAGIFWTLSRGGTLVLPETGMEHDLQRLVELIASEGVTHLLCLPALYKLILESSTAEQLRALDIAIVAGEELTGDVVDVHLARAPHAQLHNEYGPTEGTVWATAHRVTDLDAGSTIPIGRPIPRVGVHLLDSSGNPVPIGCVGEVHLSGSGIARGYLNQPAETQARFIESHDCDGLPRRVYRTGDLAYFRDDGGLVFCGRADNQVKVRGYRIELGELESVLRSFPQVSEAVVVARQPHGRGAKKIIAYLTTADSNQDSTELSNELADRVPRFMIPDTFVYLEQIPRLANGKIDVASLPDPKIQALRAETESPRNAVEATLARIWSETIGVPTVGIEDNFFAIGGDSIISIQVISRARREGIHIEPGQFAKFPTIVGLAAIAVVEDGNNRRTETKGEIPLAPIQHWFFSLGLHNLNHWNQSQLFELPPNYDPLQLEQAIAAVIAAHPMLHARFHCDDQGEWRQTVGVPASDGHLSILEFDSTKKSAFQQACHELQSSLDLFNGPLYRVARFVNRSGGPDRLLFVVHHLVVDAVSWRILNDDIGFAYRDRMLNREPRLAMPTRSYGEWTEHLLRNATSNAVVAELPFWEQVLLRDEVLLDAKNMGLGIERSIETITSTFDAATTEKLRRDANDAYHTTTQDLLVAGIALAVSEWVGQPEVLIDLEGYGRGNHANGLDVSHTVGWFTCLFPVRLTVDHRDVGTCVRSVKEQLREVPEQGVGFGILRHLNSEAKSTLQGFPTPQILFNFLGVMSVHGGDQSVLHPILGAGPTCRDPRNVRSHLIEINAAIRDGALLVNFSYSHHLFDHAAMEKLINGFRMQLGCIVEHCVKRESGYTPSDFPESGFTQAELDEFLGDFD